MSSWLNILLPHAYAKKRYQMSNYTSALKSLVDCAVIGWGEEGAMSERIPVPTFIWTAPFSQVVQRPFAFVWWAVLDDRQNF